MRAVAEGSKGNKSFELLVWDEIYVARFREAHAAPNKAKVYHKASDDFFGIVADCKAWLEEEPMEAPDV